MRRRRQGEHVQPYRYRVHSQAGHAIRDQLAEWTGSIEDQLRDAWPPMPEGIEDRPADVWEPLLAIADAAGGPWPDRARAACVALAGASVGREASLGIRLLTDLRDVFAAADKMSTADILSGLHGIDESPWGDLRGRPLDARGLAWRLSQYEVSSTSVRIGDATPKGYRAIDLHDAWDRYVPTTGQAQHPQHPQQASSEHPNPVADVALAEQHPQQARPLVTCDVPDVANVADAEGVDRSGTCSACHQPCPGYMTTHPTCEVAP